MLFHTLICTCCARPLVLGGSSVFSSGVEPRPGRSLLLLPPPWVVMDQCINVDRPLLMSLVRCACAWVGVVSWLVMERICGGFSCRVAGFSQKRIFPRRLVHTCVGGTYQLPPLKLPAQLRCESSKARGATTTFKSTQSALGLEIMHARHIFFGSATTGCEALSSVNRSATTEATQIY